MYTHKDEVETYFLLICFFCLFININAFIINITSSSNSKFKETYELFLEQVKKNENALKEYANFNIYMTANEKFKKYEMGGNFS